jgi:Protein of unknown function, DUF547
MGLTRRLALALPLLLLARPAGAAAKPELWARWLAHDDNARQAIDHGRWSAFLSRYRRMGSDRIARLAYGRVNAQDRQALDAYLESLQLIPVSRLARAEQRAFWINLYDGLTVRLILAHYPVASIRDIDISPGLFSSGPWGAPLAHVEGEAITLDDIEHRILRPIWRDPRLHYALNCAALGCPDIPAAAFDALAGEATLDGAAAAYINHPRGAAVAKDRLTLSRIYDWYAEDFGDTDEAVIAHLARYAAPGLSRDLAGRERIDGYGYDWALNDAR